MQLIDNGRIFIYQKIGYAWKYFQQFFLRILSKYFSLSKITAFLIIFCRVFHYNAERNGRSFVVFSAKSVYTANSKICETVNLKARSKYLACEAQPQLSHKLKILCEAHYDCTD